jgi:hypothetical protein
LRTDAEVHEGDSSLGSGGDSFYEYVLKQELLDENLDPTQSKLYSWLTNQMNKQPIFFDSHLEGFVPGLLALGSKYVLGHERDLNKAIEIMEYYLRLYNSTATGIGPEYTNDRTSGYALRPEVIESLFILWRVTGLEYYREMGWKIFQNIETYCKVSSGGYSGLLDVSISQSDLSTNGNDLQQSYFIAETLKYLFLLFSPNSTISLDHYVFTTEGHPLTKELRCKKIELYEPPCRKVSSSWRQVSFFEWFLVMAIVFWASWRILKFILRQLFGIGVANRNAKIGQLATLLKVRSE